MRKYIPFILLILAAASCKKESDNIVWQRTAGEGSAFFIGATADSGFIGCGRLSGNPYLVKFGSGRDIELEYYSQENGLFSSAWYDTSGIVAAGSKAGKMLLTRIDPAGTILWDTTITSDFYLDITSLVYEGNGSFLAVGSASPDSADVIYTGILFVRFDTAGQISYTMETTDFETGFTAAGKAIEDGSGNIYLPLTRKSGSLKPKAAIAKYNRNIQKLWETDLYNNTGFRAGCYAATTDAAGNVFVTGVTEASNMSGTLTNSYVASVSRLGEVQWKKYLENSNTGSSIILNGSGNVLMLNKNCFILRILNSADGSDDGIARMFAECDSYTTDAFGLDMDLRHDGTVLVAGTKAGNFWIAIKSVQ